MTTVSFKAEESFKTKLEMLATKKGINTSAYIKMIITKGINDDLSEITENGLTVAEELDILSREKEDKTHGPFKTAKSVMSALRK
ncbi:MAG: hypothetical protein Q8P62_02655 [Candidatus Peregrinibacteria bacterium]|nr:hypothetical protein [Candidatus Peregrinibacteria bacterium]